MDERRDVVRQIVQPTESGKWKGGVETADGTWHPLNREYGSRRGAFRACTFLMRKIREGRDA